MKTSKMKICFSIFFSLLYFNAKTQSPDIDSIITKESLQNSISVLADDSMRGRFTAMPETKKAAEFIANQFKKTGLKPIAGNDGFFSYYPLEFHFNDEPILIQAINVMGVVMGKGRPDSLVIFCAHYDHIGVKKNIQKNDKDSIYNGANDNASGTALLIELAKYYSAIKMNRYTLVFIAFSGEELGLLGSAYVAADIDQSLIRTVINFDMVGRSINSYTKKCMVIAETPKPLLKKLNQQLDRHEDFFINDMFPYDNLFARSDHYSFSKVKTTILLTTSSPGDLYYHTLEDEIKTIDFDFLLSTAKNIALGCKIFLN